MIGCWCFSSYQQQRQLTLLLIGLDNAGKTSILNHLRGDTTEVTPTIGFSSTTITAAGCRLRLFDVGGSKQIRRIWKVYTSEVHGIVYVVDAADRFRLDESREALQQILLNKHLAGKPVLILANKQDVPTAQSSEGISQALHMHELQQDRACAVFACTATQQQEQSEKQQQLSPGLQQGLQWLVKTITPMYPQLQTKINRETAEVRAIEQQHRQEREQRARMSKIDRQQHEKEAIQQQQQQQQQKKTDNMLLAEPVNSTGATVDVSLATKSSTGCQPEPLLPGTALPSLAAALCAGAGGTQASCPAGPAYSSRDTPHVQTAETAETVSVTAASCKFGNVTCTPDEAMIPNSPSAVSLNSPDVVTVVVHRPALTAVSGCQGHPATTAGLLNVLQAALPGAAASPEFCDLQQAVHDACGPTPRCDSLDSEASSILELAVQRKLMKQQSRAPV